MGLITVQKGAKPNEQILEIIDLGVEEVEEATDVLEVYVQSQNLVKVREKLNQGGFKILSVELVKQPGNEVQIGDSEKAVRVLKFMDKLQEHDDVQKIYANFDIPEEVLKNAPTV